MIFVVLISSVGIIRSLCDLFGECNGHVFIVIFYCVTLMQLNRDGEVLSTPQGVLLKSLTHSDAGLYHCLATENNFKHTLARVSLRILDRDIAVALTVPDDEDKEEEMIARRHKPEARPSASSMQPLEPEMRVIHQYCQSYWEQLTDRGEQQSRRPNRRHTEGHEPSGG